MWRADLLTASGRYISVTEWNSAADSGAPISRDEPPLSGAQLKKLAMAEVWRQVVDPYVKARWAATPTPSQEEGPTVAAVLGTLVPLLPKNLQVLDQGQNHPYVRVHDGRTDNVAQIDTVVRADIQHDTSDATGEPYGAETLPDGTTVATRRGPGDKGVADSVMWTVDTVRADGLRVVISAYNPVGHGTPTRPTPALTMEQMREIALSPKWDRFR